MKTENTHGKDPEFVKDLFGSIAGTYDRANDAITFGMARMWRKRIVAWSNARLGDNVLDCATGTGDLALSFKRAVGNEGRVVGSDFCPEMLELAPAKAKEAGLEVDFELGDVTDLKYEDNSFDITSIAYGIRNVSDPVKAIAEMARVTRPGGRVMILETGEARSPLVRTGIGLYFNHVVPRLGGLVSGKRSAYEYLNKSSGVFPCRDEFVNLMKKTGTFDLVEFQSLMGGASYSYRGWVR